MYSLRPGGKAGEIEFQIKWINTWPARRAAEAEKPENGSMVMNQQEQRAILTIGLTAAFADGGKDERERDQIKRIAESLAPGGAIDLPGIYQDVLLKRRTLEETAAELAVRETRQFAYEMAVCVCDADGARTQTEKEFLDRLRGALGLEAEPARAFARQADDIAESPLQTGGLPPPKAGTEALDSMILNYSILNGALELLPQTLASMAILPLQMKMVYRIGKAHGYDLDRGHIKEFAATLGVGFSGQYVEQMGRKLIGGLLGRIGGGLLGGVGSTGVGAALSFATTYALGQVAIQYYAGGRTIDAARLKQIFQSLLEKGTALQARHAGEIRQKAGTLDLSQITALVGQR